MTSTGHVLNPQLYATLQRVFRDVRVANSGSRAHVRYASRGGALMAEINGGEYYLVRCPKCRDTKQRLWISYMYGAWDSRTRKRIWHTAICYHCNARASQLKLADLLKGPSLPQPVAQQIADPQPDAITVARIPLPQAEYTALNQLEPEHPARAYIESRGYDVNELTTDYAWRYVVSDDIMLDRRIFIPVFYELNDALELVGYQTRSIPQHSPADEPKYWTAPGFRKSQVLYNLHRARKGSRVIVVEGVTAAVRTGPEAVALFGKSMSYHQANLLLDCCTHADVFVMLDQDAEAAGKKLVDRLTGGAFSERRLKSVRMVKLPRIDSDPGEYQRAELMALIQEVGDHAVQDR